MSSSNTLLFFARPELITSQKGETDIFSLYLMSIFFFPACCISSVILVSLCKQQHISQVYYTGSVLLPPSQVSVVLLVVLIGRYLNVNSTSDAIRGYKEAGS